MPLSAQVPQYPASLSMGGLLSDNDMLWELMLAQQAQAHVPEMMLPDRLPVTPYQHPPVPPPIMAGQQDRDSSSSSFDPMQIKRFYDTGQQLSGMFPASGSLMAVPGGSGFGTAAGGAAFDAGVAAVPGGLSNAAVGSAASPGFFGSLFGGGEAAAGAAGAAGAGTMGTAAMAAGPLALFLLPFMFAMNKAYGDD